jgi:hypothetical protein
MSQNLPVHSPETATAFTRTFPELAYHLIIKHTVKKVLKHCRAKGIPYTKVMVLSIEDLDDELLSVRLTEYSTFEEFETAALEHDDSEALSGVRVCLARRSGNIAVYVITQDGWFVQSIRPDVWANETTDDLGDVEALTPGGAA